MITVTQPADWPDILSLYPRAFPDEDLTGIVSALRDTPQSTLSLTAWRDGSVAGHIGFSHCKAGAQPVALLAPLAVDPDHQRTGIGRALIDAGKTHLAKAGARHIFVLGDPAYYGRFGFSQETGVAPPYDLPDDWRPAWQSLALVPDAPLGSARLVVPAIWRDPALWLP